MPRQALATTSPFKYLSPEQRTKLQQRITERRYAKQEVILAKEQGGDSVYLILEGSVNVVDPSSKPERFLGAISCGNYFGERAALFGEARKVQVVANEETTCAIISGVDFLGLVRDSTPFAQAMARNLRQKQGLFVAFDNFLATLWEARGEGSLDIEKTLSAYARLQPALHPKLASYTLDTDAWGYAVNRLPADITRAHVYLLSKTVPTILRGLGCYATEVTTRARRRMVWDLQNAKDLVLIREGATDFVDFVTMLCLHATEARKLRRRVRSAELVNRLCAASCSKNPAEEAAVLAELPLSEEERAGLAKVWPHDLIDRLKEILLHHEDYSVFIDQALNDYNPDSAERWTEQIRVAAEDFIGDLEGVQIDVISSNTHSVVNCLSSGLHRERERIFAWGAEALPELATADFRHECDRLYAMAYHYYKAHPGTHNSRLAHDAENGILTLEDTELTGIQVDLIDPSRLDPSLLDQSLSIAPSQERRLIVNIDYAFGAQAEDIIRSLILLFGHSMRSINVLGKAGAFQGKRGDILLATQVLHRWSEELNAIGNEGLSAAKIQEESGITVHQGPMLTVTGTLLQNRVLLNYYKRLWRCVGLEMEGTYYAREIERSRLLGLLPRELVTRFLYYVSDLPLNTDENLAESLAPWEGIPPLYATTRAVLSQLLS